MAKRWWWGLALLVGCARPDGLAEAEQALAEARRLDAALESAPDPAAASAARDRAFATAEQRYRQLLTDQPDLPEARLALGAVAWQARGDLATAFEAANQVVEQLAAQSPEQLRQRRSGGRTGAALLAQAYAERASYLVSRYTNTSGATGPPAVPAGPLAQAQADVARALSLDPRDDYRLLRDHLARLAGPAPLDPASLSTR